MKIDTILPRARKYLALKQFEAGLSRIDKPQKTFFMIVMPGGLHVARIAADRFPKEYPLIIIGNGLYPKEIHWLNDNFGIIDYDCFIEDKYIIEDMVTLGTHTFASCAFPSFSLESTSIILPQTFLLYFNRKIMTEIIKKYTVDARKYNWIELSNEIIRALNSMNVSINSMPDGKNYFDTLRIPFLLSIYEGYSLSIVENIGAEKYSGHARALHIGSISNPLQNKDRYGLQGSYFWVRALECCDDRQLREISESVFGKVAVDELREEYSDFDDKLEQDFLDFCGRILPCSWAQLPDG